MFGMCSVKTTRQGKFIFIGPVGSKAFQSALNKI